MKILLINPPAYTPTTFPYSLAAMKAQLTQKIDENIQILDLNVIFHYQEFSNFYTRLKDNKEDYFELLEEFSNAVKLRYMQISKKAISNQPIEETKDLIKQITTKSPDIVAFSLTYNSQIFITKQLIDELQTQNPNIKIIIGGPADYSKIMQGVTTGSDVKKFIEFLIKQAAKQHENIDHNNIPTPDFSDFNKEHYFTKEIVYPLRTSIACPYKLCTFCTHHGNTNFKLFDLSNLKETIQTNNIKKLCFIDDDLPAVRIKQISQILKDLNVKWWCQLRPTKQIQLVLKEAVDSGLTSVAWGVESGNQRILDLMHKGTKVTDVQDTLKIAKDLGIQNMTYILFGFPTENETEFKDTINFLETNKDFIDSVSPSVFGLQYGSKVLDSPTEFEVTDINFKKRTFLSDTITYKTKIGLTTKETTSLLKQYKHQLSKINKVPKIISVFKEQILNQ